MEDMFCSTCGIYVGKKVTRRWGSPYYIESLHGLYRYENGNKYCYMCHNTMLSRKKMDAER
jgi:hypothetical protein